MASARWRFFGEAKDATKWIVTTAIGGSYFDRWERSVSNTWLRYAQTHGLGIAVAVDDLWEASQPRLNGSWQKLLCLEDLRHELGRDVQCALLDTDVVINPSAPDVFVAVPPGHIGVVSQVHGIPGDLAELNNRIAFLRRKFLQPDFPLDSLLNATPRQLFELAELSPAFDDFACAGVIVADTFSHAETFRSWYLEAPQSAAYLALGDWEQTYVNHRLQQLKEVIWLDYRWQALWIFETAAFYPFLYAEDASPELAGWCLTSSLMRNYFLHLAGRWESSLLPDPALIFPGQAGDILGLLETIHTAELRKSAGHVRGRLEPPKVA
jgi:hypothetical protein